MQTDWDTLRDIETQEFLSAERHRVKLHVIGHELPIPEHDGPRIKHIIRKKGFESRYPGRCIQCQGEIIPGQFIFSNKGERGYIHSIASECHA